MAAVAHAAAPLGFDDARHLLNRTSFAANLDDIDAFARLTREQAVERLLAWTRNPPVTPPPEWVNEPFESPRRLRGMSEESRKLALRELFQKAFELQSWWLSDTEQFLRQARLAAPSGPARNAALNPLLRVEQDIVQAAANLNGNHAFATEFPRSPFGNAIRTAAQVIASKAGVAAVKVSLNGFDTHSNQPGTHSRLLKELAEGLLALRSALTELGRWNSTLVMTYAEFGRRPRENLSNGTDHGTASAHFVLGGRVRGGLYGLPPGLSRLDGNGNPPFAVDFRELYATVLERWWGVDPARALNGRFAPLDILKT